MMGRQYTQSGSANKTYENVADHSTFSISGSGDAKFKGHIGNHVRITKSGSGDLKIEGTVASSVIITASGSGDIIFSQSPPENVLENMTVSGSADVTVPGGYHKKRSTANNSVITIGNTLAAGTVIRNLTIDSHGTRYTDADGKQVVLPPGHGPLSIGGISIGGISIGGSDSDSFSDSDSSDSDDDSHKKKHKTRQAQKKDVVDSHLSQAITTVVATPLPAVHPERVNLRELNDVLNDLSPAMQTYLKSFENKLQNSSLFDMLSLEQKKSFGQTVLNIPVMVSGNVYDLQTVIDLPIVNPHGLRQELNTGDLFTLREIQPARHIANAIAFEFGKLGLATTVPIASATSAPAAAMFQPAEKQQQTQVMKPRPEANCLVM